MLDHFDYDTKDLILFNFDRITDVVYKFDMLTPIYYQYGTAAKYIFDINYNKTSCPSSRLKYHSDLKLVAVVLCYDFRIIKPTDKGFELIFKDHNDF